MIQQQKLGKGPLEAFRWIAKTQGLNACWRGTVSCAVREAIYTGGYLGLAPVFTRRLAEMPGREEKYLANSLIGSCGAGVLAALCTHPADTAKTCYQADIKGSEYSSGLQAFRRLYQDG